MVIRLDKILAYILLTFFISFNITSVCSAETVEGRAVIENGDISKAREAAKQDAMRSFVEKEVGVKVTSSTEVSMGMVVSDKILAKSEGYVQINRIVKESQDGGVFVVVLDLSANAQKIDTAIKDLKSRIELMSDSDTSRSGIQIAVTGRDESGKPKKVADLTRYVQSKLEDAGFRVEVNDEVAKYMDTTADLDTLSSGAEIRRISRNTQEGANALLRGTLSTVSVTPEGKYFKATVKASFELIGFDSNSANSFVDYFTAVGKTLSEAEQKAENIATQKAVESLSQKALKTVQMEYRGGVKNYKMTAIFSGITNRTTQAEHIRRGLTTAGCRIIRSSFASDGSFRVFLETSSFSTVDDMIAGIINSVGGGLKQGNDNENAMGSRKLYFSF